MSAAKVPATVAEALVIGTGLIIAAVIALVVTINVFNTSCSQQTSSTFNGHTTYQTEPVAC